MKRNLEDVFTSELMKDVESAINAVFKKHKHEMAVKTSRARYNQQLNRL